MNHGPFTAEETRHNVQTAHEALGCGDLMHALFHISSALATDPTHREWLTVLHEVMRRAADPLAIVRLDEAKSDFISAATRAYVLAAKGRLAEALPLLAEVAEVRPDVGYLVWAEQWLAQPGAARSLSLDVACGRVLAPLLKMVSRAPSPMASDDPRLPNVRHARAIVAALREAHPAEPFLWFGGSMIARRLGLFDEGIALAEKAYALEGAWKNAIGIACAYRDANRPDEAVRWYKNALQHDPDDLSARLDIGDTLLDAKRFAEAGVAYDEVLAREPDHPWALPSKIFVLHETTKDPGHELELMRITETGSGRAWDLFCRIRKAEPYLHFLPPPGDATAHAVRDVMAHVRKDPTAARGGKVGLEVTHPESPSVVVAFRRFTEQLGVDVAVDLKFQRVQSPDPRAPKTDVTFALWRWNGMMPEPTCPPPDPRLGEAIANIAMIPYHLDFWAPRARELASQLGPAWRDQLLCAMAQPPALPQGWPDAFDWVRRCQVAAALVVAYLDGEWATGVRRKTLVDLACGPVDWTVDAAIVALAWIARHEPETRPDIESVFSWLEQKIPQEGFTCYAHPLVLCWLGLGGLDPVVEKRLLARKADLEKPRDAAPPPPPAPAAQQPLPTHEERVGQMIRTGHFDVQGAGINAAAAAKTMANGEGGDPDPIVFPGQKIARLSQYVGLMKGLQSGDMMGALKKHGLDMGSYGAAMQAWGIKLAADPLLTAKMAKMMNG
ncbi:MAG: tetratricopeptide repeat protein [Deltaproteobacteria bacterium]|nr:tetratricopeptide repeat protein [Deltaproteobacteria bacterium]